jgi:N-methylhydantoinase A
MLVADLRETAVQTYAAREDELDYEFLNRLLHELQERVADLESATFERSADLRYVGMASELTVKVPAGTLTPEGFALVADAFHEAYERVYGYHYRGEQPVELVNLRVAATAALPPLELPEEPLEAGDGAGALTGERAVHFGPGGPVATRIYDRGRLRAGDELQGPAIVEQYDSTTVVPPGARARADGLGNLVVELP